MKKLFSALLAAAFLLMSVCMLTACGNTASAGAASAASGSSAAAPAAAAEAHSAAAAQAASQAAAEDADADTAAPAEQEAGQATAAGSTAEPAANGTDGAAAAETAAAAEAAAGGNTTENAQTAAAGQDAPVADTSEQLTTEQIAEYAQTAYNDLASAIMLGMQDGWQSVTTESLGISDVYTASDGHSFGFSIQDINNDGVPEMLIGETVDNDASSPIYDLFTGSSTGELIHIFSGGEQNRCFLYENGTLANLTEDGSFFHYVLENNMLVADDSGASGGNYVDIAFTYFIAQ